MSKQQPTDPAARQKHLRKFGLIMTVPFLVIGGLLIYKGRPAAPYFLAVAAFFGLMGLAAPRLLDPIERGWMYLAGKLSIVTTAIILSVVYYLILTPIGLVMRVAGRDELGIRKSDAETFWIPTDPDGPGSRPMKPY